MTKPFDPSQRPRPPRQRAAKRKVASVGSRPGSATIRLQPLNKRQLQILAELLPSLQPDELRRQFQDLAGSYRGWVKKKSEPQSEITFEIKMVAHLTWTISNDAQRAAKAEEELLQRLPLLTERASDTIVHALGPPWKPFTWNLSRPLPDWDALGAAALKALQSSKGSRDYGNTHLNALTGALVDLYEAHSGAIATWSNRPSGESGHLGNQQQLARSSCGRLIEAFVTFVDPDLPPSASHNGLRSILRVRNKLR